MARRGRAKNNRNLGRDVKTITRSHLPPVYNPYSALNMSIFDRDARLHRPIHQWKPPQTIFSTYAPVKHNNRGQRFTGRLQFVVPEKTLPCVRRKRRREVMFATGKGGKKLNYKKVRRSLSSSVSC